MKSQNSHDVYLTAAPPNKILTCRYWIKVFLFYAVWISVCVLRYGNARTHENDVNVEDNEDLDPNPSIDIRKIRSAPLINDERDKARVKFTVVDPNGDYIDENYQDAHATHFQLKNANERERKACNQHQKAKNDDNSKKRCARNLEIDFTERFLRQKYGLIRGRSRGSSGAYP